ncbi:NAD(P)-dependent oxidoreductase [Bacillus litorisediminis]|uniref:NAD(P)-dependent oxidoreductase n=1 Tax=Bacillus litorisediminis TaxID=2922713 RepID=UPI001FAC767D|nr:NAD(P)-dependent oxidoreductase [Bacillus litorisediminis]
MKIGFIGLGKMGGGLARNLIRAGFDTHVYDINPNAMDKVLEVGGSPADNPADLASRVDLLFTSLPLPVHLTDLFIDKDALLTKMKQGAILADVSTIDPKTARLLSDHAEENGVHFLACPLGKGPAQAEQGIQPIFVGGKKEVFDQAKHVLNKISSQAIYLGDVEQSAAFKLISNLVGMTNMLILAEGLRLGEKAGLDPAQLQELLADTGADSYQLTLRGPMILQNDFNAKFSINLALKDIRLGVGMAEAFKQIAPFSALASEYYKKASEAGYGEEDCAAVYKIFA